MMATDIDSLQIELTATATKANNAIDKLVGRINGLSKALQGLNTGNLSNLSRGVQQLGNAMQTMNAVKTADFTRLARNLNTLGSLDSAKINSLATSVERIGRSFSGLSGVSSGATQMADLAKGISQLGYKSATQAITNIPKLATAMKQLMQELSKAPKVSQNLIDMTNALARLARTGASSGRAATSLSTALDRIGNSSGNAHNGIKRVSLSLSGLFKKLLPVISIVKLFDLGKQSMELASDLTEVQNVVDATFGDYRQKMEDLAAVSIPELGMSELTAKQLGSRFQAIGTALGFSQGKMADMSVELTRLTGDMASFYNASQEDVGKALQSIFTGETEPMRRYGVDLTNATIQQWALNNGLNANISSMSQAEKAMLRYQYTMERTAVAQGDFARTQDTWANQTRILVENLKSLGSTVGTALINVFKPLVSWLNSVMTAVISAVKTIVDALGAIFGWTLEVSPAGSTYDDAAGGLEDIAGSANDAGGSLGGAADKANELKKALMGFDEINKLPDENSSSGGSGGSGGGSGGGAGSSGGVTTELVRTESVLEKYKSEIKSLEQLGKYISLSLSKAMESIDWDSIYDKARNFGTGLASFLNGLIKPRLFGNLGKTIAGAINTALNAADAFAVEFNWNNLGRSIATGINKFFTTTDFALAGNTFYHFADGILDSLITAIEQTDFEKVASSIANFIENCHWDKLLEKAGKLIWEAINAGIKTWKTLFNEKPIETTIVTALLGLKFTGIGSILGKSIWKKIIASIFGKSAGKAAGASVGGSIAKTLGSFIKTGLSGKAGTIGATIAGGLALAMANVKVSDYTGGAETFFKNLIEVPLNKTAESDDVKKAVEKVQGIFKNLFNFEPSTNDETPEIEVSIEAEDNTDEGIKSAYKSLHQLTEVDTTPEIEVDANTKPANNKITALKKVLTKKGFPTEVVVTTTKKGLSGMLQKISKNLNIGTKAEVTTTENDLQKQFDSLSKNCTSEIAAKISTPSFALQNQAQNLFSGFTLKVDALAKFKERDISGLNKTVDVKANYTTSTYSGLAQKYKDINTKANYTSSTYSGLASKYKIISAVANFISTSTKNLPNSEKNIKGVSATVTRLYKGAGLSLSLVATVLGKALTARFAATGGVFAGGSWKPITAYAGGGLPNQGQMFVAREAGPELVGTLGGHTAVMNNNQIVSSVSDGVYHAVAAAMSQFTGQTNNGGTPNITVYVGGRQVTDVVVEEVNQRTKATGMCPIMV